MKTEQEILSELKNVCDELGKFPTQAELKMRRKYNLLYEIQKAEADFKLLL